MSKSTFLRKANVIKFKDGSVHKKFDSINAAKRFSRQLQSEGHTVIREPHKGVKRSINVYVRANERHGTMKKEIEKLPKAKTFIRFLRRRLKEEGIQNGN